MNLNFFEMIFWDFDGVVKESVSVKNDAFEELFKPYGDLVCNKVKLHHIENGGMSRFKKIPLYLKWAGLDSTSTKIDEMCSQFSGIVKNKVINSSWVPGVKTFLDDFRKKYIFIIVSATPQSELIDICEALKIKNHFSKIYGSPTSKSNAIKMSMDDYGITPDKCLMFGDAQADIDAAKENHINFIFRRHQYNQSINIESDTQVISDFDYLEGLSKFT
jgi:phosphoglycolate phosphatase-like HAD superfamily hydrolase